MSDRKTMVIVFAGPNGSGKSTITDQIPRQGQYINADDIKKALSIGDMEAAILAEQLREDCLKKHLDFMFETVLSTPRNIELLKRAKADDYFIKCFYVLTSNPDINVARVQYRSQTGGHSVPENKIRERYTRALALIPELIPICDICNIYDNTEEPYRIFSKKLDIYRLWENEYWSKQQIIQLTAHDDYTEEHLKQSCKKNISPHKSESDKTDR